MEQNAKEPGPKRKEVLEKKRKKMEKINKRMTYLGTEELKF